MSKPPKTSMAKVPLAKAKATPKKKGADSAKKCPTCGRAY